jgi:hypothetical protein
VDSDVSTMFSKAGARVNGLTQVNDWSGATVVVLFLIKLSKGHVRLNCVLRRSGGKKPRVFTSVSEFLSSALEELR